MLKKIYLFAACFYIYLNSKMAGDVFSVRIWCYMANEEINKAWQKFIQGDRQAFGEIYKAYFPMLTLFCLGKLRDMAEAENCASESLLKTMNYENPNEIRDLEAWLFRIARNLCYSLITQNTRRQEIIKVIHRETKSYHAPEAEVEERWNEYEKVLKDNLDMADREIWKLHLAGYNNREIASELNMQEKTVANRKSEIRKILRKALKSLN